MFLKIVKAVLPSGEEVRLEGESARHEGHLGFFKPNDDFLIEAVAGNQKSLTLYLWLRQREVFRLFSVFNVVRYRTLDNKHDVMLVNVDGRCDDGLSRTIQKNVLESLGRDFKPPILFISQASAAIHCHLADL